MSKLLKLFPIKPAKGDTKKLILAIIFYLAAPWIVGTVGGFILGLTIILAPLAIILGMALTAYEIAGIVFAIFYYLGKEEDLLAIGKKEEKND